PFSMPSAILSIAAGWSPVGSYGETTSNLSIFSSASPVALPIADRLVFRYAAVVFAYRRRFRRTALFYHVVRPIYRRAADDYRITDIAERVRELAKEHRAHRRREQHYRVIEYGYL